jgi:hypothetical protein
MSQRIAGCCCGKCANAALGACCIKPTVNTANCLGDCEGFDPQTGLSVGILGNQTAAQCTQAGIDFGADVVFTVYPNCNPTENCDCIDSVTECVCANLNGIWNGSNSCATGCLGACCVLDLNGLPISCHNLMSECDCNKLKTSLNNVTWTVGKDCQTTACRKGPSCCTLWSFEETEIISYVSSGICNCQQATNQGIIVATGYYYQHRRFLFTDDSGDRYNPFDWTQYNADTQFDIYPTATCSDERHTSLKRKYTKIRDICNEPQNSCNIDRREYTTKIINDVCYYPDCCFNPNPIQTNTSTVSGNTFTDCCTSTAEYPPP